MPLVKIKPGLSHAHYLAGDVFDASPAEMESFGDKFILVEVEVELVKDDRVPVSWTEVVATPSARRLAQEHGISPALSNIVGTGRGGKITKADVQMFLDNEVKSIVTASVEVFTEAAPYSSDGAPLNGDDLETFLNGDAQC